MTPFMMLIWTDTPQAATGFAFAMVFAFWSLYYVASNLQNPFDGDSNDLNGKKLNDEFSAQLIAIFRDPKRQITRNRTFKQALPYSLSQMRRRQSFSQLSSSFNSAVSQLKTDSECFDDVENQPIDGNGIHEAADGAPSHHDTATEHQMHSSDSSPLGHAGLVVHVRSTERLAVSSDAAEELAEGSIPLPCMVPPSPTFGLPIQTNPDSRHLSPNMPVLLHGSITNSKSKVWSASSHSSPRSAHSSRSKVDDWKAHEAEGGEGP